MTVQNFSQHPDFLLMVLVGYLLLMVVNVLMAGDFGNHGGVGGKVAVA